ncbi:hypothetical protein [Nostoc sp. UHCC 0252]|uniref:hypothetical protein n=1 Tax=Nostoc sp. UHCC 0252 TaxID=3110241 RepID=UPI002B1EA207|nr:hypothetical protein [Nostoc sp. UHCC 0252]MEA5602217.1 hypothetical protein [Nostoc sp. UHCC 0252]
MEVFWYLPTQGDEHYLGNTIGRRLATYSYMQQIAQAVDKYRVAELLFPRLPLQIPGLALAQQVKQIYSDPSLCKKD